MALGMPVITVEDSISATTFSVIEIASVSYGLPMEILKVENPAMRPPPVLEQAAAGIMSRTN
jgi:hypothetical protein